MVENHLFSSSSKLLHFCLRTLLAWAAAQPRPSAPSGIPLSTSQLWARNKFGSLVEWQLCLQVIHGSETERLEMRRGQCGAPMWYRHRFQLSLLFSTCPSFKTYSCPVPSGPVVDGDETVDQDYDVSYRECRKSSPIVNLLFYSSTSSFISLI